MKRYGLIGYPLGHSFSKKYFTEKFENENIDATYELFELQEIGEFSTLVETKNISGLNVTIPYKEQVIPYLDELDETAAKIGAVNVIKFIEKAGKTILKGYNSDVIGFMKSMRPHLKPEHQKALILGTGGASKAIDFGLRAMNVQTTFVSRTPSKDQLSYNNITQQILTDHLVVVNTTPVGMYPRVDECPAIPYEFLSSNHFLFDVVYNPAETLFLKKGKAQGAETMNGEEMLVGQAVAAWEIWG